MHDQPGNVTSLAALARLAGVSVSTASRALAGNMRISEATRDRVTGLAEHHGFRPNQLARNLRQGRSRAIGVVLPLGHETGQHLTDPFFILLIGLLADALADHGHDLLLSRVIPTDAAWLDRLVDSGRVDGAIVIGQSNQRVALDRVAARYLPLVVWGEPRVGGAQCVVGSDNHAGGRMAAAHLLAQGRQRLAYCGHPDGPEIAERWRGVQLACHAAGAPPPVLIPVPLTADEAHAMIGDWLREADEVPEGIVAASDVVAMSALRALAEAGLRVPDDVAVTGYDDVSLAAHTTPSLTTVRQDVEEGARQLVDHLFRRIAGERTTSVTLMPQLIVRASA